MPALGAGRGHGCKAWPQRPLVLHAPRRRRSQVRCCIWSATRARAGSRRPTAPRSSCSARPGMYEAKGEFQLNVAADAARPPAIGQAQQELERVKAAAADATGCSTPRGSGRCRRSPRTRRRGHQPTARRCATSSPSPAGAGPACGSLVVDARVQGDGAVEELVRALRLVNRLPRRGCLHRRPRRRRRARTWRRSTTRRSAARSPRCACRPSRRWATRPTSRSPTSWPTCAPPRRRPRRSSRVRRSARGAPRSCDDLAARLARRARRPRPGSGSSGSSAPRDRLQAAHGGAARARAGTSVDRLAAAARRAEPAPRARARLRRADATPTATCSSAARTSRPARRSRCGWPTARVAARGGARIDRRIAERPGPAGGDRPPARGRRRRARRRARAVRGRRRPAPRARASGSRAAELKVQPVLEERTASSGVTRSRWLRPCRRAVGRRRPARRGARAHRRAGSPSWAERLRAEIGGRARRGARLRAPHPGQAGARRRSSWRPTARPAARRRRSPASPRRWRWCTPTRWCTTTCRAWTTTTSAAAGRPRTARFDVPPRPGSASCWCRWRRGCWPRRRPSSAAGRGPGRGWRRSCSRPAASRAWWAGSGSTSRPSGGRSTLDELIAVHRGKTGALIRAACALGGDRGARRRPSVVAALTAYRRGHRARLPDRRRRARRHRHQRGAGQDGRPRRRAGQVHLRRRCWASTAPGARPSAGSAGGRAPRRRGRAVGALGALAGYIVAGARDDEPGHPSERAIGRACRVRTVLRCAQDDCAVRDLTTDRHDSPRRHPRPPPTCKRLRRDQLPQLAAGDPRAADRVRARMTGGHIGASLGVVELTIALLYEFDSPARQDRLGRRPPGLRLEAAHRPERRRSRRCARRTASPASSSARESEHDQFGAGHAGTAISAALGMATARDLKGEDHKVVAVVGDGALTCGLAYEGLNNAGHSDRDIIVDRQRQRDVDLAQRRRDQQDARPHRGRSRAPTGCARRSRA